MSTDPTEAGPVATAFAGRDVLSHLSPHTGGRALRTYLALSGFLLLALVGGCVPAARAESDVLDRVTRFGEPPADVRVRIRNSASGPLIELGGATTIPIHLVPEVRRASIEPLPVGNARVLALVILEGSGAVRVSVLIRSGPDGPQAIWEGRTDWRGDPGERARQILRTTARRGDDAMTDVVVGVEREAVRVCGADDSLLFPSAYDHRAGRMRPVEISRFPTGAIRPLTVTRQADAPDRSGLTPRGASSERGRPTPGEGLEVATAPLLDGDPATAWVEGRPGPGRWEFATLELAAHDLAVSGLVVTVPDEGSNAQAPTGFWIVSESGPIGRAHLPTALRAPGSTLRVRFPEAVRTRCLSIVLDDDRSMPVQLGFAEVGLVSDYSSPERIQRLIARLSARGGDGARAKEALIQIGPIALPEMQARWEGLTVVGRRRGTESAAAWLTSEPAPPSLLEFLSVAARDRDERIRQLACRTLARSEESGFDSLAALAGDENPDIRDSALPHLAASNALRAIPLLLTHIETAPDRDPWAEALSRAVSEAGDAANEPIESWLDRTTHDPEGIVAVADALATARTQPRALVAVLHRARTTAEDFAGRYRLVRAARGAPADSDVDTWLDATAVNAEEWMLRAAAVDSLARRTASPEELVKFLDDPYPRVRVRAIEALRRFPNIGSMRIADLASSDRWPMVRSTALLARRDASDGLELALAALRDNGIAVRETALHILADARDDRAHRVVASILTDDDEWPRVLKAAIDFAAAQCAHELIDPLGYVMRRGMRDDAWAPDVELAIRAFHAIQLLGGTRAEMWRQRALASHGPLGAVARAVPRDGPEIGCAEDR